MSFREVIEFIGDTVDIIPERAQNAAETPDEAPISSQVAEGFVVPVEGAAPLIPSKQGFIFKVPAHMRRVDEDAYSPNVVSIGPIHYKAEASKAMEAHKKRFLNQALERTSEQNLRDAMKELEKEARDCYFEDFEEISSEDFVWMMVLDGCFVVELLRLSSASYQGDPVDDPIFATRWMLPNLRRDMLLLENQLPLFVLHKIFELTSMSNDHIEEQTEKTSFNRLALQFFQPVRPGRDATPIDRVNLDDYHQHLLALLHSSFLPSTPTPTSTSNSNSKPRSKHKRVYIPGKGWVNNAELMRRAGVRFRNKSGNLLDIEFKKGELTMPSIFIDDNTSPILRNLLAYEQCNRSSAQYFTFLAVFFDSIIDTTEDVKILHQAGIIKQAHGSEEEVANIFNSLPKELSCDPDGCYITKQIEDINNFCLSPLARIRATITPMVFGLNLMQILLAYISVFFTFYSVSGGFSSSAQTSPAPGPAPAPSS